MYMGYLLAVSVSIVRRRQTALINPDDARHALHLLLHTRRIADRSDNLALFP